MSYKANLAYLRDYCQRKERLQELIAAQSRLLAQCYKSTSSISSMPRGGGGGGNAYDALSDITDVIRGLCADLDHRSVRLLSAVESLADARQRRILIGKYIEGRSMRWLSRNLYASRYHISRLLAEGIAMLDIDAER